MDILRGVTALRLFWHYADGLAPPINVRLQTKRDSTAKLNNGKNMCQQWLSVSGHLVELIGFLLVAFELRHVFNPRRRDGRLQIYSLGVVLVVVGMLGQTAGGWVGRIPLDFFKSCY